MEVGAVAPSPIEPTMPGGPASEFIITMSVAAVTLILTIAPVVVLYCYVCRRFDSYRQNQRLSAAEVRHLELTAAEVQLIQAVSAAAVTVAFSGGLDPGVLRLLPVYVVGCESKSECAVCLTELREGEKARLLPRCRHTFHVECIDMWFQTHDTCPLCRSTAEPRKQESVAIAVL